MRKLSLTRRLFRWLLNIFVFAVIPALLIYYGFARLERLQSQQKLALVVQKIQSELRNLEGLSNTEAFLAKSLWKAFFASSRLSKLDKVRELRKDLDNCFDYIVWNSRREVIEKTIPLKSFKGDWELGIKTIVKSFVRKSEDLIFTAEEEQNYKKLFGPQFIPESIRGCRSDSNEFLIWPDSAEKMPVLWFGHTRDYTIAVFIKPEKIKEPIGVRFSIRHNKAEAFSTGFLMKNVLYVEKALEADEQLKNLISKPLPLDQSAFIYKGKNFYPRTVNDNLTVFAYLDSDIAASGNGIPPWVAAMFFTAMMLPYFFVSFKTIVKEEKIRLPIAIKLSLLFAFSSGLPLSILFFVGYEYLNQKEFALLDDIHHNATRYLQNFDERFESEFAHQVVKIQKGLKALLPRLKKEGLTPLNYFPFVNTVCEELDSLSHIQIYMVASDGKNIGTETSLFRNREAVHLAGLSMDGNREDKQKQAAKLFSDIGKFIMDRSNGKTVDERVSTEIELLTESAMQKNIHELQQEFIASDGKISIFGFGARKSHSYVDLISLSPDGKQDYLLLIIWEKNLLEDLYLRRQYLNANRNIHNLKVFACCEESNRFFPESLILETKLRAYVKNFSHKPHPPRQFFTLNHQKNLIMGFKGKFMHNYSLFAMYPVKEIEEKIYHEKKMLISAGLFSIGLIVALGFLLARSFLFPLRSISEGAEAIKNKDFDVRLPIVSNDEFGQIASVFNETMIDLEELKVAGIVQEQLLPQKIPETGPFKIFGKSFSMSDVGGDYYDFFASSETSFGILIGEVSGHGVGAALIMAMAKAGVLQSQDFLNKPKELVQRMHKLLSLANSSGKKRYMSFQYINIDYKSHEAAYSNAGGWAPLIVNHETGTIREIKLAGPLLGALKRPVFAETSFSISENEALILYSDGIIEARNTSGNILGFEKFCQIVLRSYDIDPARYYDNIISEYNTFVAGAGKPSDDLTLIILTLEKNHQD
ncbi:MAG: hypothetical protein Kow0029_19730 [Candidatus Rifleibacteriota bacterium]